MIEVWINERFGWIIELIKSQYITLFFLQVARRNNYTPFLTVKRIWNQLKSILPNINFPISTPQSAIFGFWDLDTNEYLILNPFLLIFKMYTYNARTTGDLNISHLLIYIKGIKNVEKKLCENDAKRNKSSIRNAKTF